ncbi:MAG TPA: amino acid ABC transporter permease [Pseudonocardiaceae bacterium]|jgi:His/Glu/Gln/Arg/opine family amino acid ABC transporter permease subunit|nr:amino acid ABC transporter permease [Pseudonocardiaceae bacterium]
MGLGNYDWGLIWQNHGILLNGLLTALKVSVIALVISVAGGLLLAVMRLSRPPISWLAVAYINVFRGVPALVSVIWVYFGVSLAVNVSFSVFQAGVIALSLLYSAFMAEIFRSALGAIPNGHREAGQALGMRSTRVFFSVVLPQAVKIALPNIGSMFIGMMKDTSTFTVIGLLEVVRVTQNLVSQTFQPFVLYTAAAALYVLAAFVIDILFRLIEGAYASPPRGAVSSVLRSRQRRRIQQLMADLDREQLPPVGVSVSREESL